MMMMMMMGMMSKMIPNGMKPQVDMQFHAVNNNNDKNDNNKNNEKNDNSNDN